MFSKHSVFQTRVKMYILRKLKYPISIECERKEKDSKKKKTRLKNAKNKVKKIKVSFYFAFFIYYFFISNTHTYKIYLNLILQKREWVFKKKIFIDYVRKWVSDSDVWCVIQSKNK